MPPPDDKGRVCIVCGRVLSYSENEGWIHNPSSLPDEVDHPVIAVLPEEAGEQIRERCDFCFADYPTWVLPARDFETIPGEAYSEGDWAACEACARLLERDRWNVLLERVRVSWEARHGPAHPEVERRQKRLYRLLRKNITGSVRRVPN